MKGRRQSVLELRAAGPYTKLRFVFCLWPRQKESDQQITVEVEGRLTSFTQTGLAAGQQYVVSISGETDGRRGAENSAEFMTRELVEYLSVDAYL